MKKIFFILSMQLMLLFVGRAQHVQGTVADDNGKALSGATVSLLRAKDSSVVKFNLSQEGRYGFTPSGKDSFLVSISYVGFETAFSSPFHYSGEPLALALITLHRSEGKLQGIVVRSRKPLIESKGDKTVLHVEGTINATGTDALELLRKSPGVVVDNDERLSLNGKNGVQVYIDGRPSPLSGSDLSNYLRSLSSSQIEAIEIIANPSVNYEASGTAGVIHIRLRKSKTAGFNGSLSTGVSLSRNARFDEGFSINYRTKKFNAFGSYNGNFGNSGMDFNLYRTVKDTSFDQHSKLLFKNRSHAFKTGLDLTLDERSSIGLVVNGSFANPTLENRGTTPISYIPTGRVDRLLEAANINNMKNNNVNATLNYTYRDSAGRSLAVNGDYGYYSLDQTQWQPNTFYDADRKNVLSRKNYRIESPTRIDIYSVKADYEQNLGKGRLGIGGKFGYVKTNNTFRQYQETGGVATLDRSASNFFGYIENVNAAYVKFSREWKGLAVQGGVRAEQTRVEGDLNGEKQAGNEWGPANQSFSRSYLDFFPSISLTVAPKTASQFALAYSRRIDRPVYKDLNPFEYRINEYSFHKGSTDIRPQYSHIVSLTHTYKFKLNTTFSYSHVKDVFGQVVDTADGVKGFLSNRNLTAQNIANLNISYPFQYKSYSLFGSLNGYYSKYSASYGAGRDLNEDVWAANIFVQNSLNLGKGWNAELSGFYTTPSIWQGSLKSASMWSADAGLQKSFLNGKASVKASVSDLFNSLKWKATSDFAGQKSRVSGKQETRQAKVSFTWRFGNKDIKAARQMQSGSEEESKRVQSSNLGH
ncbi:MAG TPA: TonB-dependent receptor [Chitinophagaceae bacterium]|nr:TonB-dependent receptor [Chitinophagaceae bacterium]